MTLLGPRPSVEPSGAAGLAAIRVHDLPGNRLATVLTGSNVHALSTFGLTPQRRGGDWRNAELAELCRGA